MARITLAEAMARKSTLDEAKLRATTEEDIRAYKIEDGIDPDVDLMAGAVAVRSPREVRERLGMTQAEFAQAISTPLSTIKNWEQGRTPVPPYARTLFNIFDREPEAALRAIGMAAPRAA